MSLRSPQFINDDSANIFKDTSDSGFTSTIKCVASGEQNREPHQHLAVISRHQQHDLVALEEANTFEEPPNAAAAVLLLPLMSRLPPDASEPIDSISSNGYIFPAQDTIIPGTLPYSLTHDGLAYTQARLPHLDDFGRAAWTAFHAFRPVTTNYAGTFSGKTCHHAGSTPDAVDLVRRVFNWPLLRFPEHLSGTLHGVVFRSKRAAGSTSTDLYEADRLAHEEAVAAGGLLMYWYGTPDATGMNLATCIWTDKESSRIASRLPKHKEAVKHAMKAYETFELCQYRVEKRAGELGVHISPMTNDQKPQTPQLEDDWERET